MSNNNKFSGAGTIIVEEINKKLCILLGQGKSSHKYTDFGGTYEKKDGDIVDTAKRELEEESMNLIKLNKKYFVHYIDVPNGEYKYRAFVVKINDVQQKYFQHNKHILEKNNAPKYWLEMSDITHFPFTKENIHSLIKQRKMISIDGKILPISYRCRLVLMYCMQLIFKQAKNKPVMMRKHLIKNNTNGFTYNTFSFIK